MTRRPLVSRPLQELTRLDIMDYDSRWGYYRIRLQPGDIEKHKEILAEVVADAYAAGGHK